MKIKVTVDAAIHDEMSEVVDSMIDPTGMGEDELIMWLASSPEGRELIASALMVTVRKM